MRTNKKTQPRADFKPRQELPAQLIRETEGSIIKACIFNIECQEIVFDFLSESDFNDTQCRAIFKAMKLLVKGKQPINRLNIWRTSNKHSLNVEINFLGDLINDWFVLTYDVAAYINIIKQAKFRFEKETIAIQVAKKVEDHLEIGNEYEDVNQRIKDFEERIKVVWNRINGETKPIKNDWFMQGMDYLEDQIRRENDPNAPKWMFPNLNKLLKPFMGGRLTLVAGEVKSGKTEFLVQNAAFQALVQNQPVLIISLEMPIGQVSARVFKNRIHANPYDANRLSQVLSEIGPLKDRPLYIDCKANSLLKIDTLIRDMYTNAGVRIVYIDYFGLIQLDHSYGRFMELESRQFIARALKGLCLELEIDIVLGAQLNRNPQTQARAPKYADLRSTGEADCDALLMIDRPILYNSNAMHSDLYVDLALFRHGPTGRVELFWEVEHGLILEPDKRTREK